MAIGFRGRDDDAAWLDDFGGRRAGGLPTFGNGFENLECGDAQVVSDVGVVDDAACEVTSEPRLARGQPGTRGEQGQVGDEGRIVNEGAEPLRDAPQVVLAAQSIDLVAQRREHGRRVEVFEGAPDALVFL